ncbi:MAG: hypothetical protein JWP63_1938 [Candidatus Solibacter sp.]|nr:hypothetical protein [Candidatus Solibacter sp.]
MRSVSSVEGAPSVMAIAIVDNERRGGVSQEIYIFGQVVRRGDLVGNSGATVRPPCLPSQLLRSPLRAG